MINDGSPLSIGACENRRRKSSFNRFDIPEDARGHLQPLLSVFLGGDVFLVRDRIQRGVPVVIVKSGRMRIPVC